MNEVNIRRMSRGLLLLLAIVAGSARGDDDARHKQGSEPLFSGFFSSLGKLQDYYRAESDLMLDELDRDKPEDDRAKCGARGTKVSRRGAVFREVGKVDKAKFVAFVYLPEGSEAGALDRTFVLCTAGDYKVPEFDYRRTGGIRTGIMVVPFKVRSGDLYGDASMGPYLAFSGASTSIVVSAGLTQVSVKDVAATDVKSETGLTAAIGVIKSLSKDFDIALVMGVDHLSGSAGDAFKYQNKI